MERSTLIKLLVGFIIVMFVLSMFTYYRGVQQGTVGPNITTVAGQAQATGRITGFGQELFIDSWNDKLNAEVNSLKASGSVDYVKIAGGKAVLMLPNKANATAVRLQFINESCDVTAAATISFRDALNFTLSNGSASIFVESQQMMIDPISPVGTEIPLTVVADINQMTSTAGQVQASIVPMEELLEGKGSLSCTSTYQLSGKIPWETRNTSAAALSSALGVAEENLTYARSDYVVFSAQLNSSEQQAVLALNRTYISAISPIAITTSTLDKQTLYNDIAAAGLNVNLTFLPSKADVMTEMSNVSSMAAVMEKAGISDIASKKDCIVTVQNFGDYLVKYDRRNVRSLILADKTVGGSVNVTAVVKRMGYLVTQFDIQEIS